MVCMCVCVVIGGGVGWDYLEMNLFQEGLFSLFVAAELLSDCHSRTQGIPLQACGP